MERYVTQNSFVLDVGTGTGVLAIAAVKLGSRFAVGIDIDEWSQINAMENVERNGCKRRVEIRLATSLCTRLPVLSSRLRRAARWLSLYFLRKRHDN